MTTEDKSLPNVTSESDNELLDIVELASAVTGSSLASIALFDKENLSIKAEKGIAVNGISNQAALYAGAAILQNDLLVIPDTLNDKTIVDQSVSYESHVRFFAAMPLINNSKQKLGILYLFDIKPKILDDHQQLMIKILASQVTKILELRAGAEMLKKSQKELERQMLFNNDASIRLRSFFESSANFHVLLDKGGDVIDFNKTAFNFVKTVHKAELKRGDQIVKYIDPAFIGIFIEKYNQTLKGIKTQGEGATYYDELGTIWWESSLEPARNDEDEIIGVSYLIRNVTERKQWEQMIVDQNKSLIKIAHIQAHDFRAPLTSIMGLMNLIKETDYEAPREYLELLEEAVYALDERIKHIITDVDKTIATP